MKGIWIFSLTIPVILSGCNATRSEFGKHDQLTNIKMDCHVEIGGATPQIFSNGLTADYYESSLKPEIDCQLTYLVSYKYFGHYGYFRSSNMRIAYGDDGHLQLQYFNPYIEEFNERIQSRPARSNDSSCVKPRNK